ncbi:helicase HerA domain-containing protein [Natrialbaceae archaeon GCM10025896]
MSAETQQTSMTGGDAEKIAIDEDGEVTLPVVEVLTGRAFLTGKSGAGKSNSASVVAEELLDRGFPLLIVDTDGEYWGLKEEYEILHVGADEECDLQVSSEHAPKLAELALEDNVPIILDVSGFLDEDEGDALVRETARELFQREKKLKKPFLMLVEEIHEYIPEGGGLDDTGRMLIRVAKRGRKRGLGLAGMSQRPADVKKDFITQCDWLLWHRLTWQNDTKVVRNVVGSDYADAVQDLDDGEAFLMADFLEADVQRVQVRRKRTFDAGATPDLDDFQRPDLKSVSGDLVNELEEISEREERRQDRIAQLEDRVEDLQDEKAELEEELENARDMRDMASQFAEAMQSSGDDTNAASEKVDELIDERNDLRSKLGDREERIEKLEATVSDLQEQLKQRPDIGERAAEAVEVLAEEFGVGGGENEALRRKLKTARERIDKLESETQKPSVAAPDEYDEFVEDEYVKDAIEDAKENSDASKRYVRGVVAGILQRGGPASRREIADDLGIETTHHIRQAMNALEDRDVVTRSGSGDDETADFAFSLVEKVHERQARQRRTEQVMEEL